MYSKPVIQARKDIHLSPPKTRNWLVGIMRKITGPYIRLVIRCSEIRVTDSPKLVHYFSRALAGEIRLILAFRHPFVDEPQILSWLFLSGIIREAKKMGVHLPQKPHALFIHGYEVPRWSDGFVRWLIPRMGAMPIYHNKIHSPSLNYIKDQIKNAPYPLALAPEGQVSYTSETLPRLEPGAVRLGFDAALSLEQENRTEPVIILPLSIHRRYPKKKAGENLAKLVGKIQRSLGNPRSTMAWPKYEPWFGDSNSPKLLNHLKLLTRELIIRAEDFYGIPGISDSDHPQNDDDRLKRIVEKAVDTGETLLGLNPGSGGIIDRVYRIRQIGWDRIFIHQNPATLSPLDRAMADRRAGEAWYAMRHMELADFAWYFRTAPLTGESQKLEQDLGNPSSNTIPGDLVIEFAQNIWDFVNRLAGGAISRRISVTPHTTLVVPGEPINLSSKLSEYKKSRKSCVKQTMIELEESFLASIQKARSYSLPCKHHKRSPRSTT